MRNPRVLCNIHGHSVSCYIYYIRTHHVAIIMLPHSQLQAILPPSAWESLSCSSRTDTHPSQELGSETGHIGTLGCDSSTEDEEGDPELDKGTHIGIGKGRYSVY